MWSYVDSGSSTNTHANTKTMKQNSKVPATKKFILYQISIAPFIILFTYLWYFYVLYGFYMLSVCMKTQCKHIKLARITNIRGTYVCFDVCQKFKNFEIVF